MRFIVDRNNVHDFEFYRAIYSPCISQELSLTDKLDLQELESVGPSFAYLQPFLGKSL